MFSRFLCYDRSHFQLADLRAFVVAPIRGAETRVSDPDLWGPVHLRLGRNWFGSRFVSEINANSLELACADSQASVLPEGIGKYVKHISKCVRHDERNHSGWALIEFLA
jgi:hypothetical protein